MVKLRHEPISDSETGTIALSKADYKVRPEQRLPFINSAMGYFDFIASPRSARQLTLPLC
jgi:hypothetical protein